MASAAAVAANSARSPIRNSIGEDKDSLSEATSRIHSQDGKTTGAMDEDEDSDNAVASKSLRNARTARPTNGHGEDEEDDDVDMEDDDLFGDDNGAATSQKSPYVDLELLSGM